MSEEAQTIFAASVNWLAVFAAASLVTCFLYNYFRRVADLCPVQYRSGIFLVYAVLPVLVATAVSTTLYFPGIAGFFLPEHCHGNDCAPHAPLFDINAGYAAVSAAAAITAIGALFYLPLRTLLRHQRNQEIIQRLSTNEDECKASGRYILVESKAAMAWCDGLIRPRIFVSSGLLDRLDAHELEVVLAHERAHAQRRDNLVRLIIDWATRLWPSGQRLTLRHDFAIAAECACDHLAARNLLPADFADLMGKLDEQGKSVTAGRRIAAFHDEAESPLALRLTPSFALFGLCLLQAWVFARVAHPMLEWLG